MNVTRIRFRLRGASLALAGLLLALGALAPSLAWSSSEAERLLAPRWAMSELEAIASAARQWRAKHGEWPADCALSSAAFLQPAPNRDPWGRPYECALSLQPPLAWSHGPDRSPGTDDDIVIDIVAGRTASQPAAAARGASDLPAGASVGAEGAAAGAAPPEAVETDRRIRAIGAALASYRQREGRYPVTDRVESLERWLVPGDLEKADWHAKDGWGHGLRYRTTDIGSSYTLSSPGSDGLWDAETAPGADRHEGRDLVLADGRIVAAPAGLPAGDAWGERSSGLTEARDSALRATDPADVTAQRMARFCEALRRRAAGGRGFPQSDDAERVARELGAGVQAVDGWGRPFHYLSFSGGRHCALASAGPDGRLGRGMEALARGEAAAGDDVVAHDGQPPG